MTALEDALALLGLHKPFTADQLQKSYYRNALQHHPDKGGDEEHFKRIIAAKDLLKNHVHDPVTVTDQRDFQFYPPSPPPTFFEVEEAIKHSNEFLQALRKYPKSSSEYQAAQQLWHCIHRASHNPMLNTSSDLDTSVFRCWRITYLVTLPLHRGGAAGINTSVSKGMTWMD